MADDSNRIGISRVSATTAGIGQVRKTTGGATGASGDAGPISIEGGQIASSHFGKFGPRGNRILPADYPVDQLDRRAARGSYLDILV